MNEMIIYMGGTMKIDVSALAEPITKILEGVGVVYSDTIGVPLAKSRIELNPELAFEYEDNRYKISRVNDALDIETLNELKKMENRIEIIEMSLNKIAEEELEIISKVKSNELYLFDVLGYANDNYEKEIWSEVIKNELTTEHKFSKRVLRILNELEYNEALALRELSCQLLEHVEFTEVGDRVIGGKFIPLFGGHLIQKCLNQRYLTDDMMQTFETYGLIRSSNYFITKGEDFIFRQYDGNYSLLCTEQEEVKYPVGIITKELEVVLSLMKNKGDTYKMMNTISNLSNGTFELKLSTNLRSEITNGIVNFYQT